MFQDPQSLVVIAVVAAAALYLSRRAWRVIFGRGGTHCGSGCGKCGDKPLVQLDAPVARASQPVEPTQLK